MRLPHLTERLRHGGHVDPDLLYHHKRLLVHLIEHTHLLQRRGDLLTENLHQDAVVTRLVQDHHLVGLLTTGLLSPGVTKNTTAMALMMIETQVLHSGEGRGVAHTMDMDVVALLTVPLVTTLVLLECHRPPALPLRLSQCPLTIAKEMYQCSPHHASRGAIQDVVLLAEKVHTLVPLQAAIVVVHLQSILGGLIMVALRGRLRPLPRLEVLLQVHVVALHLRFAPITQHRQHTHVRNVSIITPRECRKSWRVGNYCLHTRYLTS